MADKDKTTTIIQASAKGGVSAVMPYVAIGVLGYFGLKQLKNLDIGVGGVAGSIIDSLSDTAEGVTEYITNVAGDTVLFITDGVKDVGDAAKEFIPPITEYEEERPIFKAALSMDVPKSTKVFQEISTYTPFGYEDVSMIGVVAPKGSYDNKIVISPGESERVQMVYGTVDQPKSPFITKGATSKTPIPTQTERSYDVQPITKREKAALMKASQAAKRQ